MVDGLKIGIAAVVVFVVLVGLGVAAWQLDWFVQEKNTDRQTHIDDRSYARQTTLQAQVDADARDIRAVDVQLTQLGPADDPAPLRAQRKALVTEACDAAGRLTGKTVLSSSTQSLIAQECP